MTRPPMVAATEMLPGWEPSSEVKASASPAYAWHGLAGQRFKGDAADDIKGCKGSRDASPTSKSDPCSSPYA